MTSDLHRALVLKEMCLECIFIRGSSLIADPAFDTMPKMLLLELLRDSATRRSVRTQFLSAEEQEPATTGKRKRGGA